MGKILFCCINGNGLGHITRILAICRQIQKLDKRHELLVLTTSEFTQVLAKENIASVKIPSPQVFTKNRNLPVAHLTHAISSQVVATFRPDLVVIDSTPSGLMGEYLSFLNIIKKRAFIFGMFPNFIAEKRYQFALGYFGLVLMPFNESDKNTFKSPSHNETQWVGQILIRDSEELFSRQQARKYLRVKPDEYLALVNLGGGGNPQNDQVLKWILDTLSEIPQLRVVCPVQPFAKDISLIYDNPQCIPIAHYPIIEYYKAFDFAIASSGMNNTAELALAQVPSIWIPLGHPSTDQEFNAQNFERQGFGFKASPFDTTVLKKQLTTLRDERRRQKMSATMQNFKDGDGAKKAAYALLKYLES